MKITDFRSLLDAGASDESRPPAPLTGRELQDLLSPVSCEEFVRSHFARVSLSTQGHPQKFDAIFSWKKLARALVRGQKISDKRYNITASFTGGEDTGNPRDMIATTHEKVVELLNGGATICITNIHMADPDLARWAQAIRAQLNFTGTVGVNCYVSPDASGLPMHYDKRVATTLQISGKKRWKFSTRPAKPWPNTNEAYQGGGKEGKDIGKLPPEMEFREVELNPGDLLCLPAGAWHSARGIGHSLALNLYFAPRNLVDQFIPLMQNFAASNEHWRGGAPATLERVDGEMPKAVLAYLRERLDEFHKMAVEAINQDALTVSWMNSLTNNPFTGWEPSAKAQIPDIAPDQRFVLSAPSLRFIEHKDKALVPCDHGVLRFPVALAPFLQRLTSASPGFTVPEAVSWQQKPGSPSADEIILCLQNLYVNGVLRLA